MTYNMYQENILDHSRHPRNFGVLEHASTHAQVANPLCGDEIELFLQYNTDDRVEEAKFNGRGCAISMSAASMLTEKLRGMSRREVEQFNQDSILALLGVPITPARMKCATLSLEAVRKTLRKNPR